jgi:ABC-2 type transport system ATP-binding protein
VVASFGWKKAVWGIDERRFRDSFDELVELLDLSELLATTARELSLGQRMRADLALALLHQPELVLLDEPTLGLDVLARRRILSFLERVNAERGVTVFVTSHDMAELEQLAGRVVMIHRGEVAFDGDWSALRRTASRHRVLSLQTRSGAAPRLDGAEYQGANGERHEYVFDGSATPLADLLAQAAHQAEIVDVETHRPPIDAVVADLYERWQCGPEAD